MEIKMTSQEYMNKTEEYVLHTYNRFPVVFDRGEGVRLYDTDGKSVTSAFRRPSSSTYSAP